MIDRAVTLKALALAAAGFYATFPAAAAAQEAGTAPAAPNAAAPEPLAAEAGPILDLLAQETDPVEAARLAREVEERWSHSGSAAMDLLLRRGEAAMEAEDLDRAIVHLTALTDHAPGFAAGWNARAEAFFRQEQYGAALTDIEQALILEPRHFGALTGLGIILEQFGDDAGALRAFRAVQKIYPAEENVGRAVERLEQQTGGRTL